ncbi:MAG: CD225/dispanin family protein [Planctomycetota bacterium]
MSTGNQPVNPYSVGSAQNAGMAPAGMEKPPNYLVQSILVTLCCCLFFGIVAIVYAAQVDSKWSAGDYQGAMTSSKNAKTWCILALVLGLLTNGVVMLIQIAAVGAAANNPGGF